MIGSYEPPSRLRDTLSRLLVPTRWIMLEPYSPEWDHWLRVAILLGMVKPFYYSQRSSSSPMDAVVQVGDRIVWVGNYHYSYGFEWGRPNGAEAIPRGRPSFATMRLLKKEVKRLHRMEKERNGEHV